MGKTALSRPITVAYVYVRIFIRRVNVRTSKAATAEMDDCWETPQRVISSDVLHVTGLVTTERSQGALGAGGTGHEHCRRVSERVQSWVV